MPPTSATALSIAAAKTNGHSAEFVLRVSELLQRIERTDRSRRQLHRVRIINEKKATRAERAFNHDFDHLVAAAADLRETLNEQGLD